MDKQKCEIFSGLALDIMSLKIKVNHFMEGKDIIDVKVNSVGSHVIFTVLYK